MWNVKYVTYEITIHIFKGIFLFSNVNNYIKRGFGTDIQ